MLLILIRHYKTRFNASDQIMGWGDSPRADDWLEDMDFIEAKLSRHDIQVDAIHSSALGRARQTAEHFAARLGIESPQESAGLNEINYGTLYQKPKKWVAENYPLHKKNLDMVYPEGESFNQMQLRSLACVESIARTHASETVLCVAHAGVVRALLSHFLELDYSQLMKRKVSHSYIGLFNFEETAFSGYQDLGVPLGSTVSPETALPL